MNAVLQAQGLGKKYGKRWTPRECTIDIPAGHVVGLVGPNGAGKTTLLKPAKVGFVAQDLALAYMDKHTADRRVALEVQR
ncbi:ATP-binding cassette domain-containing protein [Streptosporangium soli]|nr:ATP-binding cassette domain-containing protein [Streptosporangium sp. KLBMP 9127]